MQLQLASQQIKQLEEQMVIVETQVNKLRALKDSLGDVKTSKGNSTFSQLGAGVFVKSKIEDSSEVLVDVGAKVFVEKSVGDAQSTIEKQVDMSEKYLEQMAATLQMMNQQAMVLQEQAEGLVK